MKKFTLLVVSIGLLLHLSMPAWASTSTGWQMTDGNATTLILGSMGNLEFGIWDLDQIDGRLKLIDNTTPGAYAKMEYDSSSNVYVEIGESAGSTLSTIGGSGIFGFYFTADNGASFLDYDYTNPGGGEQYLFTIPSLAALLAIQDTLFAIQSDVTTAVPIPASALLLGSGLIGLVGFRRRRNES